MNDRIGHPGGLSLAWVVDAFGVVGLGLLIGPVHGGRVTVLLASAVLTLAATLGIRWRSRGRAARRRIVALDAYAHREIARARGREAATRHRLSPALATSPCREGRTTVTESLAADLTSAAYTAALPRGLEGSWLELELGLWRALAEATEEWLQGSPPPGSQDETARRREAFLQGLTARATSVALEQGVRGPAVEVELCLHQTLHSVLQRAGRAEP